MAKLYFRHGPVSSGKTMDLCSVVNDYARQGKTCAVVKPSLDTRWSMEHVTSRSGLQCKVDFLIDPHTTLDLEVLAGYDTVVVDEAQFLTPKHVESLRRLADEGTPVICYGLRTDFRRTPFEGSLHLLSLADRLEARKITCFYCLSRAVFNIRLDSEGRAEVSGEQIQVGDLEYRPVCSPCYSWKVKESCM